MLDFRPRLLAAAVSFCALFTGSLGHAAAPVTAATLEVDERDAPRGIQRVHLVLPVKAGKLTLLYPKWLPAEHAPNGPIGGLSGLKFSAAGQTLAWRRDDVD